MGSMKFYIASRLENAEMVRYVASRLKAAGWQQTYDWTEHGSVDGNKELLPKVAQAEMDGVTEADIIIVMLPAKLGTHVELGMAIAKGKKVIIHANDDSGLRFDGRTCSFYWLPQVKIYIGSLFMFVQHTLGVYL